MIAFIFNIIPHYREEILCRIEKAINCDIYTGHKDSTSIKLMDKHKLKSFKYELKNIYIGRFFWQFGIRKLLKKEYKTYIITGNIINISSWFLLFYAKLFKKKTILWGHGFNGKNVLIHEKIKHFYYNLSTCVFLYGDFAKEYMISKGFDEHKLIPVYNSLSYTSRKSSSTSVKVNFFENNNLPYAIFVGRIQKSKKIDILIEAVNNLNNQINLLIIGPRIDSDIKNSFEKLNKQQSNIFFYGALYDENKLSYFISNALVTVSPGDIGLLVMHSLTYGTPVITHNRPELHGPEHEAIIKDETGDFFEYDDVDDLTKTIKKWILLDLRKREELKLKCKSVIDEKYNSKVQIEIIKNQIEKLKTAN